VHARLKVWSVVEAVLPFGCSAVPAARIAAGVHEADPREIFVYEDTRGGGIIQ
jgi:hypothetical protein